MARGGLGRYPGLADAHDLMARILSDQGDLAGAFDAWADALRLDPMRTGALKGIAFLYFRAGDAVAAIDHLQRAAEADPDDESIAQALARVRRESRGPRHHAGAAHRRRTRARRDRPSRRRRRSPSRARRWPRRRPDPSSPFAELDGGHSLVLVDANGLRLAGSLPAPERRARPATASRRSSPASRGRPPAPPGCSGSGPGSRSRSSRPTRTSFWSARRGETVLLAAREPSLPMARIALVAERAARAAKSWLERVQ